MSVTVDCELTPGRQRWWYICLLICLYFLLIGSQSFEVYFKILLIVPAMIFVWLVRNVWEGELSFQRIRFIGAQLFLYDEKDVSHEFEWQGRGRISHAFIKFELEGVEGSLKLIIWKDMVSSQSWRALNMAFHVHQPALFLESSQSEN